ncbi:MAG: 4Fe-4S ferredoxin, partial [Spirochaetales bacterium]|nr:4Fe-4S ferredoxin [Spirochaetales bacterium]
HWPVQMHLINVDSPHFQGCDLLLAADCTAYAFGGFHSQLLSGRKLAIACPKLDDGTETYIEKLTGLIDRARINTLTVAIMEVPCCGGLVQIARMAADRAERKVPIKQVVVGASGEIVDEGWL